MKNKQFLRLVSGALAASMAFTTLPVTALATSGVGGISSEPQSTWSERSEEDSESYVNIEIDGEKHSILTKTLAGTDDESHTWVKELTSIEVDVMAYDANTGTLILNANHEFDFTGVEVHCKVINNGTIVGGEFYNTVETGQDSYIKGGSFYEEITGYGNITNGKDAAGNVTVPIFAKEVVLNEPGYVNGGIYANDFNVAGSGGPSYNIYYINLDDEVDQVRINDRVDVRMDEQTDDELERISKRIFIVTPNTKPIDVTVEYIGSDPDFIKWENAADADPKKITVTTSDYQNKYATASCDAIWNLSFDENGIPKHSGSKASGWEYRQADYWSHGVRLYLYQGYRYNIPDQTAKCYVENYGTVENGIFDGIFSNFGTIENGTFKTLYNNYASNADNEQGYAVVKNAEVSGETDSIGVIYGGTYYGKVTNGSSGGSNPGYILGGVFYDDVTVEYAYEDDDEYSISGGLFFKKPTGEGLPEFYTVGPNADIMTRVTMDGAAGNTFYSVPGYKIALEAEVPEGQTFVKWTVNAGTLEDATKEETTLTMPEENVEIGFETKKAEKPAEPSKPEEKPSEPEEKPSKPEEEPSKPEEEPSKPEEEPSEPETKPEEKPEEPKQDEGLTPIEEAAAVGTGVAVVGAGVAILGFTAYQIGTELVTTLMLPAGADIPTTRTQLAVVLWKAAGCHEVPQAEGEEDIALHWAVEQGILPADGAENVSRLDVIKAAWKATAQY